MLKGVVSTDKHRLQSLTHPFWLPASLLDAKSVYFDWANKFAYICVLPSKKYVPSILKYEFYLKYIQH